MEGDDLMAPNQHMIRIDDEVYAALQARAEPLRDNPNIVLRRLLGLPDDRGRRRRLRPGLLMARSACELSLLQVLAEAPHGDLVAGDAIALVGEKLADQLTEVDREPVTTGEPRWSHRVREVRRVLIDKGDMASGTPRGVWRITEQGRRRIAETALRQETTEEGRR